MSRPIARKTHLSLSRLDDRLTPAAYSWNWSNLSMPGNWDTATNWSPNGIPATGDSVTVPSGKGGIYAMGPKTVAALDIDNGWSKTFNLSGHSAMTRAYSAFDRQRVEQDF
jgi:hypothetical protein